MSFYLNKCFAFESKQRVITRRIFNTRPHGRHVRRYTTGSAVLNDSCVVYSQCLHIFGNLSLEEWMYRNMCLKGSAGVMLMWRNGPSVVVGRHQNPWLETRVSECEGRAVCVSRRNSGGGTVYHDLNNLNISFISHKTLYNRFKNLVFIQKVLLNKFNIDLEITEREDLVLRQSGHKISGTASKVGAHNSYHHLTLLIDVDMNQMKQLIAKPSAFITSKATESIRSKTANLKSVNKDIELEDVVNEMAIEFCRLHGKDVSSGYMQLMADETNFIGLKDIESTFRSWQWIYGKTPRFTVTKQFVWKGIAFSVELQVFHGLIEKLSLTKFHTNFDLEGIPFTQHSVSQRLKQTLSHSQSNYFFDNFLSHCIIDCLQQTL